LQQKYYSTLENPDYGKDIKKFCYLYKYSVAHGYYIYSALQITVTLYSIPNFQTPSRDIPIEPLSGALLAGNQHRWRA
jgi:hypothetical protein